MKFETLKNTDIECRVAQINEKGLTLLLYKNARVDMDMLDRTVGAQNWTRKHYDVDGVIYCEVGIWDEDKGEWVVKSDCGTESNVEKEKGASSDSFKRACFNWGIGRALYTAPFIWLPATVATIKAGNNGKCACFDKFSVEKILYSEDGKRITALSIWNDTTNKRAFVWQEVAK